jgi:hypothetical protein
MGWQSNVIKYSFVCPEAANEIDYQNERLSIKIVFRRLNTAATHREGIYACVDIFKTSFMLKVPFLS